MAGDLVPGFCQQGRMTAHQENRPQIHANERK
jgi:hypothetical protein